MAAAPSSISMHKLLAFRTHCGRNSLRRKVLATAAMAPPTGAAKGLFAPPPLVLSPSSKHTATVVWLHGIGDSGHGWRDVLEMLALSHIKWIVPSAPIQPVTINGGFAGPSWFDILGMGEESPEDVAGLDRAAAYVMGLLEKEKESALWDGDDVQLGVGGFSQGGALSLYTTSRWLAGSLAGGEPVPDIKLSAAVCLSGWLPGHRRLPVLSPEAKERAKEFPVLMCHGEDDQLVPTHYGRRSGQALRAWGLTGVRFISYDRLGHAAGPREMADMRDWFLQQYPSPAA